MGTRESELPETMHNDLKTTVNALRAGAVSYSSLVLSFLMTKLAHLGDSANFVKPCYSQVSYLPL